MPNLPLDLLRKRLQNELQLCSDQLEHVIAVEDPEFRSFPVKVLVTLVNSPGPIMKEDQLAHKFTHQFQMAITGGYPYEKPIVLWQTPIFHPNIQLPEDKGHVCTRLLSDWSFQSNLLKFIKGIELLLTNPNPKSPWGTDSCTQAAEYFNKYKYEYSSLLDEAPKEDKKKGAKPPRIVDKNAKT